MEVDSSMWFTSFRVFSINAFSMQNRIFVQYRILRQPGLSQDHRPQTLHLHSPYVTPI